VLPSNEQGLCNIQRIAPHDHEVRLWQHPGEQ
jgi:hypothetical protein